MAPGSFYTFLTDRKLTADKDRIAKKMARLGVDPYLQIERFLSGPQILSEGFLGNFWQRIKNAWSGFWREPNPRDSPMTRFEYAQQALNDLHQMVQTNQGADHRTLGTILQGLEASVEILNKIEPMLKVYDDSILNYAQTGVPHSDPQDGLPEEWHNKWGEIMKKQNAIMKEPDSEDKKNKLIQTDLELGNFLKELSNYHQTISPHDAAKSEEKQRIEKFLQKINNDSTFRYIRELLDYARRRTDSGTVVQRPRGHEKVYFAWRKIATAIADPTQRQQKMIEWYNSLTDKHPLKTFVRQEMSENPELGGTEQEVFWKYAYEWINKFPHHMA